jgi:hypothetical protein
VNRIHEAFNPSPTYGVRWCARCVNFPRHPHAGALDRPRSGEASENAIRKAIKAPDEIITVKCGRENLIPLLCSSLSHQQELDFGTILCWADNVVGQQKEPCVFHLIAAGKPDIPYNCTLVNQTSESLEVDCNEGEHN